MRPPIIRATRAALNGMARWAEKEAARYSDGSAAHWALKDCTREARARGRKS